MRQGHLVIPFTHDGVSGDYIIHIGEDANISKSILLYRYNGKICYKMEIVKPTSGAGQKYRLGLRTQMKKIELGAVLP